MSAALDMTPVTPKIIAALHPDYDETDLLIREMAFYRIQRGMSVRACAKVMGTNARAVRKFERKGSDPTLAMLRHYAWAVGVMVRYNVSSGEPS